MEDEMAKNFDEIVELVNTLTAHDTVYKVECDELKHHLSNAYDKAKQAVAEKYTWAGKWELLTRTEQALNIAIPYEMRHMYGKTFEKVLDATNTGEYKDAILTIRGRFRPIYLKMQALIARQVKARRPVESTRTVIGTRKQNRGQCPHCMREQAVTPRGMAEHGFVLQWESRRGSCYGTDKPHHGTEAGRLYQEKRIVELTATAKYRAEALEAVKAGVLKPVDKKTRETIDNPTATQVRDLVTGIEGELYQLRMAIKFYAQAVKDWTEHSTREVDVAVFE
jgi:hypothetical protein